MSNRDLKDPTENPRKYMACGGFLTFLVSHYIDEIIVKFNKPVPDIKECLDRRLLL